MKRGYVIIGFWIILLVAAASIVGTSIVEEQSLIKTTIISQPSVKSLPIEEGVFKLSYKATDYLQQTSLAPATKKTMASYYKIRAYPGAPPTIPHAIESGHDMGGNSCLQCHQNGGYVEKFDAYAPITPHADYINCKQCHVPVVTSSSFKPYNWHKIDPPKAKQQALAGSPPIIPHSLAMRNNCLACHAGPSAPEEIRVTHPNRINCRQCHALNDNLQNISSVWIRK